MKNYFILFSLLFIGILGTSEANACTQPDVDIAGPSGRCGALADTPTTYTGSHNFPEPGCTYYEWTITGGTVTGPNGTFVTDGTLCITEDPFCFRDLSLACDEAGLDATVITGNGSNVTVTWQPGVVGKLKLKVKEKESGTTREETITNDISLPNPTSISFSPNTTTSGSFTAVLPQPLCTGQSVRWTIDGNNAGTGNPKNLNVGLCTTATVCAATIQTVGSSTLTSQQTCRSFNGGTLDASISGQTEAAVNGFYDYFFSSSQPITSINWTASPAGSVNFVSQTNDDAVFLGFLQTGNISLCASGTTSCGNSFQRCLTVNVTQSGGGLYVRPDEDVIAEVDRHNMQPPASKIPNIQQGNITTNNIGQSDFVVFPTLVSQGQEITVQLPVLNDEAILIVSDMQGRTISQIQVTDSAASISTSDLPTGVFILTAYSGQWMESTKFVIN